MYGDFSISIPTHENGTWTTTDFDDKKKFIEFVFSCFKEPGKYELDETALIFNEQARLFTDQGKVYCMAPYRSRDFITYWESEKKKCRAGVIFKNEGKIWYLPRDYYMWINFLPIYDKIKKKFDFPLVWDVQIHMALYECLAELNGKHAAITKKRQIASSYFHCAKLINQLWFEEGVILKMGASLKDYINLSGSWKFLDEYKSFLNSNTAWYRPMNPGKVLEWQQQIEVTRNGRKHQKGLKGMLQGISFEQSATRGVGGPTSYFFYEEAGIAPTMRTTYEFIRPSMKMGEVVTGMFIAAGSVGELSAAEHLKEFLLYPDDNDIYAVETDLIDETGTRGRTGLFIPEQWGMPPYIDEFGNSMVKEALGALDTEFEEAKKNLSPQAYQLRISQHPRNIKEAFATRNVSTFPLALVEHQKMQIQDKMYPYELVDLDESVNGDIVVHRTNKPPVNVWPIKKDLPDKEGSIVVWERPDRDISWGKYVASIDPVGEGKAEAIDNLVYIPEGKCCIGDIKKGDYVLGADGNPVEVLNVFPQGIKELYRVTFNDGSSILVCKDHLWRVFAADNDKKEGHVLSVSQMLNSDNFVESIGLGRNKTKVYSTQTYYKKKHNQNRWKIPICEPLNFKPVKLPLDPYLLGLLLGDGGLSTRSIHFSTADQELVENIQMLLPSDITIKHIGRYDYRVSTSKSRNSISKILRDLGLMGKKSGNKFIPEIYKYGSVKDRIKLIQGLMDTDGYCGNHGAEYYSISKDLAYGMVELVQSLGGIARIRYKVTNRKIRNGCGYIYVVRVTLPKQMIPFTLKRKVILYKPSNKFSRYISDIRFEKMGEAVCIQIADKGGLYVTENALVTHNTTTSESLCSIYIYKMPTHIQRTIDDRVENFIEGDKIVAAWCGRFDDINDTHKRLRLMLEWYNAQAIVENNVSLFIRYMIEQRKQRYLVPKSQILFLKEIQANKTVYQDYGWKNTGTFFSTHLLNYLIEYLKEVVEEEVDDFGTVTKKHYGIRRIPDIMAMVEMQGYDGDKNVDRLVSLTALIAYVRVLQANTEKKVVIENQIINLENSQKMSTLDRSAFRTIGKSKSMNSMNKPRSPFKRLH